MAVVSSGRQDRLDGVGHEITVNAVAAVINDLSTEIGEWSEGKGFREDWKLAEELDKFARYAEGGAVAVTHDDVAMLEAAARALKINIIGTKLMLTVSELSEALETLRDNGVDIMAGKGNFGEELADAVIRLGDLAHLIKSPLGDEVIRKVDKNVDRPYKHGRQV